MDDEFLEKMDSLWFFSSILRPSSHLTTQSAEISTKNWENITYAEKQNQEVEEQTMAEEPRQIGLQVKEGHNWKEIASLEKRREKRKGRKSKTRVQKWVEQSSPEMQFEERTPFSVIYDSQLRITGSNGGIGINSKFRHLTVPQVRDDLAMKAQLRSWAYAVACSVR